MTMTVDSSELFHADGSYDPVKAREYYLRTRKLKGRKKAGVDEAVSRIQSTPRPAANKSRPKAKINNATKRRRQAEARVAALEQRLEHMKDLLSRLVTKAKARSGVPEKKTDAKKTDSKSTSSKSKEPSKLTAAQKTAKAKASKKAYDKEMASPQAKVKQIREEMRQVQAKIDKIKQDLKAEAKNTREKAAKVTPTQAGNRSNNKSAGIG